MESEETEVTYLVTKDSNIFQPIESDGKTLDKYISTFLLIYEYLSNALIGYSPKYINLYIDDADDMKKETFYINGNKIANFNKLRELRDLLYANDLQYQMVI